MFINIVDSKPSTGTRIRIPGALVSNNGKQFDNPKFIDFCAELKIKNYYSSPAHP